MKTRLPLFAELKPPRGLWDTLPPLEREILSLLQTNFHLRDGSRQEDGSVGSIRITPRELLDLMAMTYSFGAGLKVVTEARDKAKKLAEAAR